jgi:hypothetical protein
MRALDLAAALALAVAAFLGARKGLWRMLAGGVALALGAFAAMAVSGVLAGALDDLGVAYPGDLGLGFFLPFALVSVYARYIAGLWLSKRLARRPERNRALGAAAGALWMLFTLGFLARTAGFGPAGRHQQTSRTCRPHVTEPASEIGLTREAARATEPILSGAPFCAWLARYPGATASRLQPYRLIGRGGPATWEAALRAALDGGRIQARTAEADREASSSLRAARSDRSDDSDTAGHPRKPMTLRLR